MDFIRFVVFVIVAFFIVNFAVDGALTDGTLTQLWNQLCQLWNDIPFESIFAFVAKVIKGWWASWVWIWTLGVEDADGRGWGDVVFSIILSILYIKIHLAVMYFFILIQLYIYESLHMS